MICNKCGNTVPDGASKCDQCGNVFPDFLADFSEKAPTEPMPAAPLPSEAIPKEPLIDIQTPPEAAAQSPDSDASAEKARQIRLGVKIFSFLLCLLFFVLPLVRCSYEDSLSASGWQIATGTGDLMQEDQAYPIVFVILILPAVVFFMSLAGRPLKLLRNVSIAALVAFLGVIVSMFAMIEDSRAGRAFEVTGFAWFVALIHIALIAVAHYGIALESRSVEKLE